MLEFGDQKIPESKCYVTLGSMNSRIDRKQIPQRGRPFGTIHEHPFNHTVEILMSEEAYDCIEKILNREVPKVENSKVFLTLAQLVEGEFFNIYIKTGNVLMLSEGRLGVDNVYSLNDGILRLNLDKESYERAGLVGKPAPTAGKRGERARWLVEINLRLPSMLSGKKGFDRIAWSFKNVLKDPVAWLFCDLTSVNSSLPSRKSPPQLAGIGDHNPVNVHHPIKRCSEPKVYRSEALKVQTLVPPERSSPTFKDEFEEFALELQEWLALASIDSPRVRANDEIDPFLSRYEVHQDLTAPTVKMVRVQWTGILPTTWIVHLFTTCLLSCKSIDPSAWFAFTVHGFRNAPISWEGAHLGDSLHSENGYTVMSLPSIQEKDPYVDFVMWELVGAMLGKT